MFFLHYLKRPFSSLAPIALVSYQTFFNLSIRFLLLYFFFCIFDSRNISPKNCSSFEFFWFLSSRKCLGVPNLDLFVLLFYCFMNRIDTKKVEPGGEMGGAFYLFFKFIYYGFKK